MLKETLLAAALSFAFVGVAQAATPPANAASSPTAAHVQKTAWHANKNGKHKKADTKKGSKDGGSTDTTTAPATPD